MKIAKIETLHIPEFPNMLIVAVHTEDGLVGYADTFYMPQAVRGFIHEFAAPRLIGTDAGAIEKHWRRLYEIIAHSVGKGAELRALSAIDVCLWDILGQAAGMPVWQLLGGASRDRIRTYNTCGGPGYGRARRGNAAYGTDAREGRYEDLVAYMTDAGALARDLLSEGITAMKIWPFDFVAFEAGAYDNWRDFPSIFSLTETPLPRHDLSAHDIDRALTPFRQIRDAVGDAMDIMLEGHGLWSLPAAKKIARAVEPYKPFWLEDLMRADDIGALAELRASTSTPVIASEYLATRWEFKPVLEQRAADIIMVDPTWAGGITETRKIATMAETYKRPVAMHDCTGPFTLFAGIHLSINAPNALLQESVRAYLRVTYRELVTTLPTIENGHILAPTAPGLGTTLRPDVREREGVSVVVSE